MHPVGVEFFPMWTEGRYGQTYMTKLIVAFRNFCKPYLKREF